MNNASTPLQHHTHTIDRYFNILVLKAMQKIVSKKVVLSSHPAKCLKMLELTFSELEVDCG